MEVKMLHKMQFFDNSRIIHRVKTSIHSCRMRTCFNSRWVCLRGVCLQVGLPPGGFALQGGVYRGAEPPDHVTFDVCSEATPPPVDRQTPVKTLPCPKFRLRAVIRYFCLVFAANSNQQWTEHYLIKFSQFFNLVLCHWFFTEYIMPTQ